MPLSPLTRKSRNLPFNMGEGQDVYRNYNPTGPLRKGVPSGSTTVLDYPVNVKGSQVTDSESHQYWRVKTARHDVGGPFFSQKKYYVGTPSSVTLRKAPRAIFGDWWQDQSYVGTAWPFNFTTTAFPPTSNSTEAQLNALGTKAVSLANPLNSLGNLAAFLGELREGMSHYSLSALKDRTDAARRAGNAYLTTEFGWKPLVSDVLDIANRVTNADRIINQYVRDAGRIVRRRWEYPPEETVTVLAPTAGSPFAGGPSLGAYGPVSRSISRIRKTERRCWFSGAFTYFLPSDFVSQNGMGGFVSQADKLLGTQLTPEVLWELTPWSWAIDWFSNVGNVISNVSDRLSDGLIMRYGYLMEHTIITDTYTLPPGVSFNTPTSVSLAGQISLVTETKTRVRANPFGFGLNWNGLTPYQLSIAAALGLSRS